ncbi:MAG: hypothetical protein RLZZ516_2015 [Cyanobacteriota bacterium]|jgi:hypothetical protein
MSIRPTGTSVEHWLQQAAAIPLLNAHQRLCQVSLDAPLHNRSDWRLRDGLADSHAIDQLDLLDLDAAMSRLQGSGTDLRPLTSMVVSGESLSELACEQQGQPIEAIQTYRTHAAHRQPGQPVPQTKYCPGSAWQPDAEDPDLSRGEPKVMQQVVMGLNDRAMSSPPHMATGAGKHYPEQMHQK